MRDRRCRSVDKEERRIAASIQGRSLVRVAYRDCLVWNYPLQGLLVHEDHMMVYLYQEKIAPPGPLRASPKPPEVLTLQLTIKSLEQENAWLKEHLARIVRDK
jgi:hypothetical protein